MDTTQQDPTCQEIVESTHPQPVSTTNPQKSSRTRDDDKVHLCTHSSISDNAVLERQEMMVKDESKNDNLGGEEIQGSSEATPASTSSANCSPNSMKKEHVEGGGTNTPMSKEVPFISGSSPDSGVDEVILEEGIVEDKESKEVKKQEEGHQEGEDTCTSLAKEDGYTSDASSIMTMDSNDDSSSSDSEDEDDSDSDDKARRALIEMGDEDEDEVDGPVGDGPLRTKNEVDPSIKPRKDLKIPAEGNMCRIGRISHSIADTVVIQSGAGQMTLDMGSILVLEDREVLGEIFDVFGPVTDPLYSIRFADLEDMKSLDLSKGRSVFYVESTGGYVATEELKKIKGSDASNPYDEEVAASEVEYSDDEAEAMQNRKKKQKGKGGALSLDQASRAQGEGKRGRGGQGRGGGKRRGGGGRGGDREGTDPYEPLKRRPTLPPPSMAPGYHGPPGYPPPRQVSSPGYQTHPGYGGYEGSTTLSQVHSLPPHPPAPHTSPSYHGTYSSHAPSHPSQSHQAPQAAWPTAPYPAMQPMSQPAHVQGHPPHPGYSYPGQTPSHPGYGQPQAPSSQAYDQTPRYQYPHGQGGAAHQPSQNGPHYPMEYAEQHFTQPSSAHGPHSHPPLPEPPFPRPPGPQYE